MKHFGFLPHVNRQACSILISLGVTLLFLQSCTGRSVSSFEWTSPKGKAYKFSQGASFPAGKEQIFTTGKNKNRYILQTEAEESEGQMFVVSIDVLVSAATVAFELSKDGKGTGTPYRFSVTQGTTHFYMPPILGGVKSVEIEISAEGNPADGTELAKISSMRYKPGFAGYQRINANSRRISSGFNVSQNSSGSSQWQIRASGYSRLDAQVLVLAYENRSDSEIRISGKRRVTLRCTSSLLGSRIPLSLLFDEPGEGLVSIDAPGAISLHSAYIETLNNDESPRVDPGVVLLATPFPDSVHFVHYVWDILPEVIILDFFDYDIQDAYLKRLAFFVEKKGYVGRLAANDEIASLHGWNAHDYKAEDLGRFFDLAKKSGFQLNPEEIKLKEFLLEKGIIEKTSSGYRGKSGALISITRESPNYLRRTFLTHEASHAIFFTDKDYRSLVQNMWASMPREERYFWYLYFGWMNYDTSSDYLMANEMQSYLVQQPIRAITQYFSQTLKGRLLENHPELEPKLQAYFDTYGGEFEKKASQLDAWLKARYGFGAGMMYFLR
jgi:hypothetical protein